MRKVVITLNRLSAVLFSRINSAAPDSIDAQIARGILDHFKQLDAFSLSQLAQACHVSPIRLKKFIKELGYESYSDLKKFNCVLSYTDQQLNQRLAIYNLAGQQKRFLQFAGLEYLEPDLKSKIEQTARKIRGARTIYLAGSLEMVSLALNFQTDLFQMDKHCYVIKDKADFEFYHPDERLDLVIIMTMTGRLFSFGTPLGTVLRSYEASILISRSPCMECSLYLPIHSEHEIFDGYYWVLFYLDQIKAAYWNRYCL